MRPRHAVVYVQWHEVATGLWCWRCMLPSAVRWALLDVGTLNVMCRIEQCADCNRGACQVVCVRSRSHG
jgi:hypothetical protein